MSSWLSQTGLISGSVRLSVRPGLRFPKPLHKNVILLRKWTMNRTSRVSVTRSSQIRVQLKILTNCAIHLVEHLHKQNTKQRATSSVVRTSNLGLEPRKPHRTALRFWTIFAVWLFSNLRFVHSSISRLHRRINVWQRLSIYIFWKPRNLYGVHKSSGYRCAFDSKT